MRDKIALWSHFYDPARHNDEQLESLGNPWVVCVKLTSILMLGVKVSHCNIKEWSMVFHFHLFFYVAAAVFFSRDGVTTCQWF